MRTSWLSTMLSALVWRSFTSYEEELVGVSLKATAFSLPMASHPMRWKKLQVLADTTDGFKIAEADLRLRGPGELLGTAQSGLADLRFVEFLADTELIREARALAEAVLKKDPMLAQSPDLLSLIEDGEFEI